MKLFLFNRRTYLALSLLGVLLATVFWHKHNYLPATPTPVNASAQAITFRFLNSSNKTAKVAQPALMLGSVKDKQRMAITDALTGDLNSLDTTSLTLKNVTNGTLQNIALRMTLYGFDGKPLSMIPSLPVGKELAAGQTQDIPLNVASRSLQSKAAQIAASIIRVDVSVDYVLYANGNMWRNGYELRRFNGFSRPSWVIIGREAAANQLIRTYQQETGAKVVVATDMQKHFRQQQQLPSRKTTLNWGPITFECTNWIGTTYIDCGPTSYSGCETVIDYGNYIPPYHDRFSVYDDVYCFPLNGPTNVNCWTLPPFTGTYYDGACGS